MSSRASSRRESTDYSGDVFLIASDGSVLNLPVPSNSPRDPLNWSAAKRARAGLSLVFFSVIGLVLVQGPSLMFKELAMEFGMKDTKPFNITVLLSAPTLFMGIGTFVWVPLSLAIGRRPVFLFNIALMLLATIWAGLTKSFFQLLTAICLQGMVTGIYVSAMLLMIIDLTFIHQRPHAIAFFWCVGGFIALLCLALTPQLVKIGNSWRSFYFTWSIPSIVALVSAFFFYEETYFVRPAVAFDGKILVQTATEKFRIYDDWDDVPGGKRLPELLDGSQWHITMSKLKFWGTVTRGGWRKMLACYPQILLCICNPLIFWVALLNSVNFGGMLSIGMTYPAVLTASPYNLPINSIALVNVAAAFGALIGWPATGILISKVSQRLAKRNDGVRDAEYYLPAYVLPVLASTMSVVLYGLTAQFKWHYIFIYISYFLNTFATIAMGVANTLWVTEAFPRWAAGGIVVVGGGSYIVSFGMSFLILPWVKSQGYAKANIEIGIMVLVIGGLLIPVALWGKSIRHYINRRWARYEVGALRPQ